MRGDSRRINAGLRHYPCHGRDDPPTFCRRDSHSRRGVGSALSTAYLTQEFARDALSMSLPLLPYFGDVFPAWPRHSLLIFTFTYLCGQAGAALGWFVYSPLWIGGLLASASLVFLLSSRSTGILVSC